jgi:hypothetical protein
MVAKTQYLGSHNLTFINQMTNMFGIGLGVLACGMNALFWQSRPIKGFGIS